MFFSTQQRPDMDRELVIEKFDPDRLQDFTKVVKQQAQDIFVDISLDKFGDIAALDWLLADEMANEIIYRFLLRIFLLFLR